MKFTIASVAVFIVGITAAFAAPNPAKRGELWVSLGIEQEIV